MRRHRQPYGNDATSNPDAQRAAFDVGPGRLSGGTVAISEATLSQIVANGEPDQQLAAESIRTQVKSNANFNVYPFAINPPEHLAGVHPVNVVVVSQQIAGSNNNRKSLVVQETINAGRQAVGVTQAGVILGSGQTTLTESTGTQAAALLSQMLQTSFLADIGAGIAADSPAPSNPVTVVAQWGPPAVAGTPIVACVGVLLEAI